jgi:hypothetical protein
MIVTIDAISSATTADRADSLSGMLNVACALPSNSNELPTFNNTNIRLLMYPRMILPFLICRHFNIYGLS